MTDDEGFGWLCAWRWPNGEPVCPKCGKTGHYRLERRSLFRCCHCARDYSPTSGTNFSHVKLPLGKFASIMRDLRTKSAYSVAKAHGVNPRTTWLIANKLKAEGR